MPVIIDGTLGVNAAAITTTNWTPTNIATGDNTTLGDASSDTLTINSTIQPGIVISGASSTDALRVTQTGSGNALVIEDADNPDSTPFVIDSEGRVAIGTPAAAYAKLSVQGTAVASDTASPITIYAAETFGPSTTSAFGVRVNPSTSSNSGTPYTINLMRHFYANQGTFSADSTVTSQIGFHASSTLIGAGTNYGFYSDIASGTNRYNFYSNGTAPNYFAGKLFLNAGVNAAYAFQNNLSITGATTAAGNYFSGQVQSDVVDAYGLRTDLRVASSAFTLNTLTHYAASQDIIGANATVTSQYGFLARGTLIGATNNYGFRSDITAATGRWNFYASGDANNYFAGNVGVGTNAPFSKLTVYGPTGIVSPSTGEATGVGSIRIENGSGLLGTDGGLEFKVAGDTNGYGAKIQALNSGGAQLVFANRNASATWVERMRIKSDGTVSIPGASGAVSSVDYHTAKWNLSTTGAEGLSYQRFKVTCNNTRATAYVKIKACLNSDGGIPYAAAAEMTLSVGRADGSAYYTLVNVFNVAGVSIDEPIASGNDIIFSLSAGYNGTGTTPGIDISVEYMSTDYRGVTADFTWSAVTGTSAGTSLFGVSKIGYGSSANVFTSNGIGLGNTVPTGGGTGIRFPVAQSASSDPNTLDDYEEGTWTPAWAPASGYSNLIYSEQLGQYVKVGKAVHFWGRLVTTAATAGGGGTLGISGLPFTPQSSIGGNPGNININFSYGWASATDAVLGLLISPGSTQVSCYTQYAGMNNNAQSTASSLRGAQVYFIFGGTYFTS